MSDEPAPAPIDDDHGAPHVLVVCRANVARSPLMQVRLQWEADRRSGPGTVQFASAGIQAIYGQPAASQSQRVAERWGLTLDGHRSVPIMYTPFDRTPLNLVMSHRHVRALVSRDATVAARTFTVPELVASLASAGAAGQLPHPTDTVPGGARDGDEHAPEGARPAATLRDRVAAVVAVAHAHRPSGRRARRDLDVPDPLSGTQRVFDALGDRFEIEAAAIADALFGPVPAPDGADPAATSSEPG